MEKLTELRKEIRRTRQAIIDNCDLKLQPIDLELDQKLCNKLDALLIESNALAEKAEKAQKKSLSDMYLRIYA